MGLDQDLVKFQSAAAGLFLAACLGFLAGRTREAASQAPRLPKAGIRDFIILAVLGGLCACIGQLALTVAMLAAAVAFLFLMRMQQPRRHGVTTEMAALVTFLLGYMCFTEWRSLAILVGVVLAFILANKEELRFFSVKLISQREFDDTLKFLAMIFVIYPLLPSGGYGPFQFFEPRKIWFFVILVSSVSYVGYFLSKFLDEKKSGYLGALVGGLASTTAYTAGVSKVVADSPNGQISWAKAVLLANAVMFPRMLVIAAAFSEGLARALLPSMATMTLASLLGAWLFCREGRAVSHASSTSGFKNPFSLLPALKFGLIFMAVLFLVLAGKHYLGNSGQWITSAVGGLIDVAPVLVSQAGFVQNGSSPALQVVPLIVLAAATNGLFKWFLAWGSKRPPYYWRVAAGFALSFVVGVLTLFLQQAFSSVSP